MKTSELIITLVLPKHIELIALHAALKVSGLIKPSFSTQNKRSSDGASRQIV